MFSCWRRTFGASLRTKSCIFISHTVEGAISVDVLNRIHWCERENHISELTFVTFGLKDVHQCIPLQKFSGKLHAMIGRLKLIESEVVVLGPTPFLSQCGRSVVIQSPDQRSVAGFSCCFYRLPESILQNG